MWAILGFGDGDETRASQAASSSGPSVPTLDSGQAQEGASSSSGGGGPPDPADQPEGETRAVRGPDQEQRIRRTFRDAASGDAADD